MEKLELKHLAPYLPYGLNIITNVRGGGACYGKNINRKRMLNFKNIESVINSTNSKPILIPLSDLTKDEYRCLFIGNPLDYKIDELPYKVFVKLLELHFDVFHLIPQGLAIDINTL